MAAVSKETGTLVVAEELVDHKSSSGAKRAAGCATSSDREINVELDGVVLVVLVVVLLARRPPSCLPRRVNTPASFTDPATKRNVYHFGVPFTVRRSTETLFYFVVPTLRKKRASLSHRSACTIKGGFSCNESRRK